MRRRHRSRSAALSVTAALLVAMATAACSSSTNAGSSSTGASGTNQSAASPPSTPTGTFRVGLAGETDGWDPITSQWSTQGYYVAQTIFDPLISVAVGPDGKPALAPYLAQSVTSDPTHQHWTITLRPGISFSDGEPLDGAAVALQFNLAKTTLAGSLFGNGLIAGATATGPLTVRLDLTEPDVAFEQILASQIGFIAAPNQLRAPAAQASSQPIGTGPFTLQSWVRDAQLTVVRNPNYWRKDVVHLDSIVFKVIPDDNTRLAALSSGQIDYTYSTAPAILKQYKSTSGITELLQQPTGDPSFIAFNTTRPPFDDVRLRQAISYATHAQQAVNTIGLGYGFPATEPYPPGTAWYSPSGYPTTPNLAKARSLVARYKADHHLTGPVPMTVTCLTGQNQSMDLYAQQWSAAGFQVNEQFVECQTLVSNVLAKDYQAACFALFGEGDPDGDVGFWQSGSLLNFTGLSNPAIDHDIQVGRTAPNISDPVRHQVYADLWRQFATLVPYAWLTFNPGALFYDPSRVHNLYGATFPDGQRFPPPNRAGLLVPIVQVWVS